MRQRPGGSRSEDGQRQLGALEAKRAAILPGFYTEAREQKTGQQRSPGSSYGSKPEEQSERDRRNEGEGDLAGTHNGSQAGGKQKKGGGKDGAYGRKGERTVPKR